MSAPVYSERRGPSLWAIILIAVGVIWLLAQANVITSEHLSVLFRVWPIVLIGLGLELLVGRQSYGLSSLIVLGTIALLIVLMLAGPSLGLASSTEVTAAHYTEPLDNASSAQITVGVGVGDLHLDPLNDSAALFDADIHYIGQTRYDSTLSGDRKSITLNNDTGTSGGINVFDLFSLLNNNSRARWNVGISPEVPVALNLSAGTGSATLNLSRLDLTSLSVNSGTGSVTLTLPANELRYDATISTGTGSLTIDATQSNAVGMQINSGTGSVTIDLPDDAPIRLDAETGTGSISVASFLSRTSSESDSFVGEQGIWESASYANASESARIDISFDGGTGSLTVR